MDKNQKQEIQFPRRWEFRLIVMAELTEKVRASAAQVISGCAEPEIVIGECSGGGKYCALRAACEVTSLEQAKELATALSKVDGVRFML